MKIENAIPKGTRIHEFTALPGFWHKLAQIDTGDLKTTLIRYGRHRRQYLLSVAPLEGAPPKSTAIIYFHGGGWRFGKPEFFLSNAKVLAACGYEVFLPSVRRIPLYNYRQIRQDLAGLLKIIGEIILPESNGVPRIVLGGMSAGGNLAALTVFDEQVRTAAGVPASAFKGLFLCGAPLNFRQMAPSLVIAGFAGRKDGPLYAQANPIDQLTDREQIPVLGIHGEKDGLVEFESAQSFLEKLKSVNTAPTHFEVIPGGTHLDAGAWVHEDGRLRKLLLNWLDQYCGS